MLLRLMSGLALPAGELAVIANVSPQTASEHLAKLVEGQLLGVERQGRHRYYRLASSDVADAIESLLVLAGPPLNGDGAALHAKASAGSIRYARSCYAHLAGWVGVRITESLEERGLIKSATAKTYFVTRTGRAWFQAIKIPVDPQKDQARRCLDWTERRHHLAGPLGRDMYKRFRELGWIMRIKDTRAVRITIEGRTQFWKLLRIPLG
jgi:predicted transcriptional regulator